MTDEELYPYMAALYMMGERGDLISVLERLVVCVEPDLAYTILQEETELFDE